MLKFMLGNHSLIPGFFGQLGIFSPHYHLHEILCTFLFFSGKLFCWVTNAVHLTNRKIILVTIHCNCGVK